VLNTCPPNAESEIENLKRKLNPGAESFLTQPIRDPDKAKAFLDQFAVSNGTPLHRPVLVDTTMRRTTSAAFASAEGAKIAIEWGQGVYFMPKLHRYELVAEISEAAK
jgi:5,10-methylenetetrahydrofolate reductase